jgi:hypothetical protein
LIVAKAKALEAARVAQRSLTEKADDHEEAVAGI